MARGDLTTACARLAESLKLDFAVGTLLNLATCEERSGKVIDALEHFKVARSRLDKDDFRVAFTTEQIAKLSPRVARLTLHFAGLPPKGTRVTCDGNEVASLGCAYRGRSGDASRGRREPRAAFLADRRFASRRRAEARRARSRQARARSRDGASSATRDRPSSSDARRSLMFGSLGLGLAGIAVGTVTGIMTINSADTYSGHCVNGECDNDGLDAASTGRTVSVVSPIAFAIGAAFLTLERPLLTSPSHGNPAAR